MNIYTISDKKNERTQCSIYEAFWLMYRVRGNVDYSGNQNYPRSESYTKTPFLGYLSHKSHHGHHHGKGLEGGEEEGAEPYTSHLCSFVIGTLVTDDDDGYDILMTPSTVIPRHSTIDAVRMPSVPVRPADE